MASALNSGRGIRYYPSKPEGKKPPECAGIYYIYDSGGNRIYVGQAINLKRRVYQHRRNGKIPKDGYVDCFKSKEGITYNDLDSTEREKIDKYNPPLNLRRGGAGRKSPILDRDITPIAIQENSLLDEPTTHHKRNSLYAFLGYEKTDKSGNVHYIKEPKSVVFLVLEIIVKAMLIVTLALAGCSLYLLFSKGIHIGRPLVLGMIAIPIVCFTLFTYIRKSKVFFLISLITVVSSILIYFMSYPFAD